MSLNFTDENTLIEQEQQIEIENEQDCQKLLDYAGMNIAGISTEEAEPYDEAVYELAIERVNASPLHQLLGYDNEHSDEHNEPFGGT